jgi:hypothetical protein
MCEADSFVSGDDFSPSPKSITQVPLSKVGENVTVRGSLPDVGDARKTVSERPRAGWAVRAHASQIKTAIIARFLPENVNLLP